MQLSSKNKGNTLPELMVSALIVAAFFSAIFEVNAVCLRYISASKENIGAIEGVQDRLENLRALTFASLTDQTAMTTLLTTPANVSDLAKKVTETVTISAYPVVAGGPTAVYTRSAGASVTPSASASGGSLASVGIVRVDIQYDWTLTLGGRARTEKTSSLISDGTKK